MKLETLVARIPHQGGGDCEINAITYDSRRAGPGTLFVCLVGARTDGHRFAASAYQNGCRAFLAERALDLPADAVQIQTSDTRGALAVIGADFYGQPARQLHLIGITGTKGKTTTALLTAAILNAHGCPCAYIGSNGVDIAGQHYETVNTTPESLELQRFFRLMADAGVTHCVLEVSSQALAHHRVDGLPFEAVAFTNLSPDHIGTGEHPDFEDYKNSKHRLFTDYAARCMVCNADDEASAFMRSGFAGEVVTFGIDRTADYHGTALHKYRSGSALGIDFVCRCGGQSTPVRLLSPGAFSVSDALCAIALCGAFGVGCSACAAVLAHTPVQGRFELVEGLPGRTFVIDYAHNGLSLTSALHTLRDYAPRRLICVIGTVGGKSQIRRQELAGAASAGADYTILTSDNPDFEDPAAIIAEMAAHMAPGARFDCILDRREAIRAAITMAGEGDIVLFAGKGHETYQLIKGVKTPFVEREIIRDFCREISFSAEGPARAAVRV